MKLDSVQSYLDTLEPALLSWMKDAIHYTTSNYPEYPLVFSYQRPMIKIKPKRFIMFGGGKTHFSIYTTDFEYVDDFKLRKIKGITFGKSAILFPLGKPEYKTRVNQVIDEVVKRAVSIVNE